MKEQSDGSAQSAAGTEIESEVIERAEREVFARWCVQCQRHKSAGPYNGFEREASDKMDNA